MGGLRLAMIALRHIAALALAVAILLSGHSVEAVAHSASDLSAVRKKVRVYRQPVPAYRWRPADPSFDQYGRLYRPPPGLPCPIDLGYGRWASCSNR